MKRNFHLRLKHSLSDIQLGGRECLPRLKGRVLASGILCVNSISDTSQEKVGKKNPDALNSRTPPTSLFYSFCSLPPREAALLAHAVPLTRLPKL